MLVNKKFDKQEMLSFMNETGDFFIKQLHVNNLTLEEYAQKMCEKGTIAYEKNDDKVIAMVIGYTDEMINNMSYITQVYVLPEYRKKGLASILLEEYIIYCKEKKIDGIWLTTQKDNHNAINLYKSKGFEIEKDYDDCLIKMILKF